MPAIFYQHPEMCCQLGDEKMCRTCHKRKRKFPHEEGLVTDQGLHFCVTCSKWLPKKRMRFSNQFIDNVDNICTVCFRATYVPTRPGLIQVSSRVIRFQRHGEERRCAEKKHWVPVAQMERSDKYVDGVGTTCQTCRASGFKRKIPKSVRKHYFKGRKIKQQELEKLKEHLRKHK